MKLILKRIKIILFLFLLCTFKLVGQQPSHFILGEEELSGINIYDLHQDSNGDYWIASNNGLYKYDSYTIERIDCSSMTSTSVFNIIEDYEHNVHCHNLSGQIFQIKNDTCKEFFKVPDSLISNELTYEFDNQNRLTVVAKKLFQVTDDKNISFINNKKSAAYVQLQRNIDSSLVFCDILNEQLITLKDGKSTITPIEIDILTKPTFAKHNHKLIAYDRYTGKLLNQISTDSSIKLPNFKYHNNFTRYYSDNSNFWVPNLSGGVFIFDKNLVAKNNYKPIFKSQVISAFLCDNEGNIVLGTFGNGLIVITNQDILDIKLDPSITKITKLTSSTSGEIYLGTQEGEIYKVDTLNQFKKMRNKGYQQIEILEYLDHINCLLFNGIDKNLMELNTGKEHYITDGSIKDICKKNEFEYFISTNSGITIFDSKKLSTGENLFPIHNLEHFIGRTYCVGYDSETKSIYSGTALGLKIGNLEHADFFTLDSKTVLCRDILHVSDKMIVTTKKHGVLIFKNDKLIDNWTTENGLLSNSTKLIKEYDNKLFLSTDLGLNILNKDGEVLNRINKSNGLNANNIVDFEVVKGHLWILTNKGIQKIKLDKIVNTNFTPSIEITNIHVNENIIDTNIHEFEHLEKKFVFEISSKSLKYQNDIYYQYQLEGIDKDWITTSYNNHIVEYKSLPPNQYEFKVKAIHQSKESNTIHYSFIIRKPYWDTWWFYTCLIAGFLIITFIVFKYQIKRQRRKTRLQNQLSLTQLTALKSQMNPHFIFNSLNSIQDLILQQDRENAYNYISKFALLVRKILHQSDKDFIEIEDEIKTLTVYLELEELRFKKDFSFTIDTNNINDIEIPPMLIQPFVENALKHGLLHKKGNKFLSVIFELDNEILTCEITDNGIGRQKSNEIKQRQKKTHNSFSVKSIHTRFDILKDLYGHDLGVDFEDLSVNNEPSGTKVLLKIPFKRKF